MNQLVQCRIEILVFAGRFVHVLDGDRIRKLIVREQIAVPVINIAAGSIIRRKLSRYDSPFTICKSNNLYTKTAPIPVKMINNNSSREVSRLYRLSPILLNNLIVTSFDLIHCSVQQQNTRIYKHCHKDCVDNLRQYDMFQIKNNIKSTPQKIQQYITGK